MDQQSNTYETKRAKLSSTPEQGAYAARSIDHDKRDLRHDSSPRTDSLITRDVEEKKPLATTAIDEDHHELHLEEPDLEHIPLMLPGADGNAVSPICSNTREQRLEAPEPGLTWNNDILQQSMDFLVSTHDQSDITATTSSSSSSCPLSFGIVDGKAEKEKQEAAAIWDAWQPSFLNMPPWLRQDPSMVLPDDETKKAN